MRVGEVSTQWDTTPRPLRASFLAEAAAAECVDSEEKPSLGEPKLVISAWERGRPCRLSRSKQFAFTVDRSEAVVEGETGYEGPPRSISRRPCMTQRPQQMLLGPTTECPLARKGRLMMQTELDEEASPPHRACTQLNIRGLSDDTVSRFVLGLDEGPVLLSAEEGRPSCRISSLYASFRRASSPTRPEKSSTHSNRSMRADRSQRNGSISWAKAANFRRRPTHNATCGSSSRVGRDQKAQRSLYPASIPTKEWSR